MDFNFVTNRLATGAAVTNDNDVQQLLQAGITHVIDCRFEQDLNQFKDYPQITYLYDGTIDDMLPKSSGWFIKGGQFALDALNHPHNKVYAHCAAGQNRGPSMTYFILRMLGLNPQIAENLIRQARPQVTLAYMRDADRAIKELGYE